jgi:hypothetical protein
VLHSRGEAPSLLAAACADVGTAFCQSPNATTSQGKHGPRRRLEPDRAE